MVERCLVTPLILSVADQALLSAFSLLLSLVLIRVWLPERFGVLAVILAISLIAYSIQHALVGAPLVVLRQHALDRDDEKRLLTAFWMASCVLTAASAIVTWAGVALVWQERFPMLPLAASVFVAATLIREYVRSLLFSELRAGTVLAIDTTYIAAGTAALVVLWRRHGALEVSDVCLAMALAGAAVSVFPILSRARLFSLRFDRLARAAYGRVWRQQSRWALFGAITYEVTSRAHVLVVGAFFGAAAVGILQAGEMIFRPLRLVLQAWARIAQPTFARLAATADDTGAAQRLTHASAAGIAILGALFILAAWSAWPLLETHVFRGAYDNIHLVVMLWGLATIPRLLGGIYGTQLQGMARFRELCLAGLGGSLVALVLLGLVVALGSFEWSIMAAAAGALVELGLMLRVLPGPRHASRQGPAVAGDEPALSLPSGGAGADRRTAVDQLGDARDRANSRSGRAAARSAARPAAGVRTLWLR